MLVSALGITACVEQSAVAPSASTLIVHAVIDADARDQYVFVQTTNGIVKNQSPVPGALVTITGPDGQVMTADEVRDSTLFATSSAEPRVTTAYRISLDQYHARLVAGATYLLHVVTPSGAVVGGSTVLPAGNASAVQASPAEPFDRAHDTLSLSWAKVPYARTYQVNVSSAHSLFTAFADASLILPGMAFGGEPSAIPVFWTGVVNRVTVLAVDANYYDYYRMNSDFFSGTGILTHLEGAYGLFGAIARVSDRTLLVK